MKKLLLFGALSFCVLFGGEHIRQVDAAVLLPYGTNVGRVLGMEINLGSKPYVTTTYERHLT